MTDGSRTARRARELMALTSVALREDLIARPLVDSAGVAAALRQEASLHYLVDAAEARRIAGVALQVAAQSTDPVARGWAERTLAEALLFSGRMREADGAYARAVVAWKEAGTHALLGQLLVGRIHVLTLLGRMDEVHATAREAQNLLAAAGDRTYLAKLAMNLGSLHFQRDEPAEALAQYERAADLFAQLGVRDQSVIGLEVNRAVALTQIDRDEEALRLFTSLSRECGRRGFGLLQAQVWMNAAYVHALRGDSDLALAQSVRATAYFRETGHPAFLGNCLINHAEMYQQLNLHRDALPLVQEAAGLFDSEDLRYDRALALAQSAWIHLEMGELSAALQAGREAMRLFRGEKNLSRAAVMRLLQAEVLLCQGERSRGRRQARTALQAFRHLGLLRWEAAASVFLAQIPSKRSPRARIAAMEELLARIPKRLYPIQTSAALEQLGRGYEEADAPREAGRAYARAVNRLEGMRLRAPTEDSKIAFLSDKTHLYDHLLRLELARPRPSVQRLFAWMERARAQSLWDRIRHPASEPLDGEEGPFAARPSPAAQKGVALRRRLSWLHARVSRLELGTPADRQRADDLRRDLRRAEEEWTCLRRTLREGQQGGASRRRPGGRAAASSPTDSAAGPGPARGMPDLAPSLRSLIGALDDQQGFLSYHIAEGFSLAIAVTAAGAQSYRLADDLSQRLSELRRGLDFQWAAMAVASTREREGQRRPASGAGAGRGYPGPAAPHELFQTATTSILHQMYELLWQPLVDAGLPDCRRWVISPHGVLHQVPVGALLGPAGYLSERCELGICPSARVWCRTHGRRAPKRAFLAGVPTPDLPAIEAEIEMTRELLSGWSVTTDMAPTRATLRREAARAGLVHLAAHGALRTDNPAFSSIQLQDGPLYVHDLSDFRLPGSTVVLTACSSGRGVAPGGDEWIGLARGFLSAGARHVVASLWPIHDAATQELMGRFYAEFAGHADPTRALTEAMRGTRASRPHPWHWASFAVLSTAG
ncbi:MAG: CHAT domain-containing protein [Candidatus Eisenbacteria bacterium]|uniref:CHAT domain-containing protein n=1 Tax=Eiseniibacteriota bacterium TaxID=2212470 RepID=A0A948S132_UNCEI|nr:CHAT domain-containing protein [Candidatus Eisenbacteria bacterium]MBU1947189.1 CHAT domain-containing protein [Candidatus Eisenbacteria bacterium]MBU2693362.1 CHAT domain-containing protein [Candidatus Eisenbacteria bacterium]